MCIKKLTRLLQLLNIIASFIILCALRPTHKTAAAARGVCFCTHNQILACGTVWFCYPHAFSGNCCTKHRQKKSCLPNFFSWVSLFLSLIHPPTPPSIADSSSLLLLCCWRQLIVSAFLLLNRGVPQILCPGRCPKPTPESIAWR